MNDTAKLVELLKKKVKLVAMLAPSFPIMYEYPQIVGRLKRLGFSYVVEVAVGAKKTNEEVLTLLKNNPGSRFIASPCASFVRLVRKKHPQLLPYLAFKADSPMVATAKIVREKYPGFKPVFIGPCIVKKLESSEDYSELDILVVNYKELDSVLQQLGIVDDPEDVNSLFDMSEKSTRIYPMDAGLTDTSGIRNILNEDEIMVVSGWKNCETALEEFEKNQKIRFLDILFCDGGCINGPGISSNLNLEERKKKIIEFAQRQS